MRLDQLTLSHNPLPIKLREIVHRMTWFGLLLLMATALLSACDNGEQPAATPTIEPTATLTPTSTPTPGPTDTPVPTSTPTPGPTDTPVPTSTPTPEQRIPPFQPLRQRLDQRIPPFQPLRRRRNQRIRPLPLRQRPNSRVFLPYAISISTATLSGEMCSTCSLLPRSPASGTSWETSFSSPCLDSAPCPKVKHSNGKCRPSVASIPKQPPDSSSPLFLPEWGK